MLMLDHSQPASRPGASLPPVGGAAKRVLDVLPHFLTVFLGQRSFGGPRRRLGARVGANGGVFRHYCRARPGITGLWQVSGRNETTFSRRSNLDHFYLQSWSMGRDLLLML